MDSVNTSSPSEPDNFFREALRKRRGHIDPKELAQSFATMLFSSASANKTSAPQSTSDSKESFNSARNSFAQKFSPMPQSRKNPVQSGNEGKLNQPTSSDTRNISSSNEEQAEVLQTKIGELQKGLEKMKKDSEDLRQEFKKEYPTLSIFLIKPGIGKSSETKQNTTESADNATSEQKDSLSELHNKARSLTDETEFMMEALKEETNFLCLAKQFSSPAATNTISTYCKRNDYVLDASLHKGSYGGNLEKLKRMCRAISALIEESAEDNVWTLDSDLSSDDLSEDLSGVEETRLRAKTQALQEKRTEQQDIAKKRREKLKEQPDLMFLISCSETNPSEAEQSTTESADDTRSAQELRNKVESLSDEIELWENINNLEDEAVEMVETCNALRSQILELLRQEKTNLEESAIEPIATICEKHGYKLENFASGTDCERYHEKLQNMNEALANGIAKITTQVNELIDAIYHGNDASSEYSSSDDESELKKQVVNIKNNIYNLMEVHNDLQRENSFHFTFFEENEETLKLLKAENLSKEDCQTLEDVANRLEAMLEAIASQADASGASSSANSALGTNGNNNSEESIMQSRASSSNNAQDEQKITRRLDQETVGGAPSTDWKQRTYIIGAIATVALLAITIRYRENMRNALRPYTRKN